MKTDIYQSFTEARQAWDFLYDNMDIQCWVWFKVGFAIDCTTVDNQEMKEMLAGLPEDETIRASFENNQFNLYTY